MTLGCDKAMYEHQLRDDASNMYYLSCPNVTNAQNVSKIRPELIRR